MEDNIRRHVEGLFAETTPTRKAVELKEEMIQNLSEKYRDLVSEGKTNEAAYNITIAGIGDISALLAELEKDMTNENKENYETNASRQKSAMLTIICWIVSALVLTGLLIWLLTSAIFSGWGLFQNFNIFGINAGGFESLTGPFEVREVRTESATGINTITVNWVAGEVTVIPYDGDSITISESAQRVLRNNEQMRVSTTNGILRVDFRERSNFRARMPRKNLEVLVPYALAFELNNLSINSTSGSIYAEHIAATTVNFSSVSASIRVTNITSQTINLSTTSGAISGSAINTQRLEASSISGALNFTGSDAHTVDLSTTSGAMVISGAFDRIDTSTVSGSTYIESQTVPGRINSSSVSGSTEVHIPNAGEITVSHSAVSGRFSSDVPVIMQSNAAYSFSSVSGNTNIFVFAGE